MDILLCLVFPFRSNTYASIYVYPLQFLFLQQLLMFWVQVYYLFGKFIPKYFIYLFFCCNCRWIVFLVSFTDSSFLVYINITDFWIFILYPLLLYCYFTEFYVSILVVFLVEFLGFSLYSIMSSANNDSCTFHFGCLLFLLIWLPSTWWISSPDWFFILCDTRRKLHLQPPLQSPVGVWLSLGLCSTSRKEMGSQHCGGLVSPENSDGGG